MSDPPIRISGISGRSGSGMSTLAMQLVHDLNSRGLTAEYASFMAPVHSMLASAFGIEVSDLVSGTKKFECYPPDSNSFHSAAIDIHMGIRIGHSDGFSCYALQHRMDDATQRGVRVLVVDDVRAPNEKQFLEDKGGKLVRISAPGFAGDSELYEQVVESHDLSDHELDEARWYVSFDKRLPPEIMSRAVLMTYKEYLGLD